MSHLTADKAQRAIQTSPAFGYLFIIAHDADKYLGAAQISGNLYLGNSHKADSWVLQLLQNNLADFLLHELLNFFYTKLAHISTLRFFFYSLFKSLIEVFTSSMV